MTAEILSILDDYDVSEVRFFHESDGQQHLPKLLRPGAHCKLLIVNRSAVSKRFYDYARRLAGERKIEILEFSSPRRNV